MTSRNYFDKMNLTLGSVVPLEMFYILLVYAPEALTKSLTDILRTSKCSHRGSQYSLEATFGSLEPT